MRLFHFHKWRAVSVNNITCRARHTIGGVPMGHLPTREWPATTILFRCECGDVKTQEIEGHWTLADVTATTSDKDFLKSAGVKP